MPEFPEVPGNDVVVSKGRCPVCPTEEGNVTYEDGHAFCFACSHHTPRVAGSRPADPGGGLPPHTGGGLLGPGDYKTDPKRKLTAGTLRKYGYFTGGFKGKSVEVAPYYSQTGEPCAQKVRFPDKSFIALYSEGSPKLLACRLFGHQVYGDRFDRQVIITEGEIDAMTVAQALDFKSAVVSINGGASNAAASIKANYLWLDRFDSIVLWFDDDEPGHAATGECAKLFAVGKVKTVKLAGCKDASDCFQRNTPGDIPQAIFMANAWRPAGIMNAQDHAEDVCAPTEDATNGWSFDWPWVKMQEMLGPILPGQVTYHVAGTGIGKSTAIAEIETSLLKQGCKLAHMGFEDTRREVKLRLMGIQFEERLDIRPRSDDEMAAMHKECFGHGRLELFDPSTAEWTVDAILGYIRYCARALDCQVVVVDPLTFIAAGLAAGDDERRTLDKVSRDIAAMAKELGIHIQVVHHLTDPRDGAGHTEGAVTHINQVRGSGGIANFATFVIGHERNQQAEGPLALLAQLRSLKNRPRSKTGPILTLGYSPLTGRLLPTNAKFPGPKGSGRDQPFPAVPSASDDAY